LTYAALKTIKSLEKDYQEILQGMYNPDTDPKFAEYKQKANELVVKYADREEQGEIKLDANKNPTITDQIVEYQNDMKKLQEEYAETLKLVNGANDFNRNYLNQAREVTIYTWAHIEQVPDEIPGVFMLYMFKSEF
jgi:beta-galactosidase/beta-glucuronidase